MPRDFMDDYVPVQERIDKFKAEFPSGSLQSEIVELTASRVTVKAYAYRDPEDFRPGVGHSSLDIPGATGFTKGSEIENAETSAWGRAIAALGFEVKRGIASKEEVRNKQQPPVRQPAPPVAPDQKLRLDIANALRARNFDHKYLEAIADRFGIPKGVPASVEQLQQMLDAIEKPSTSSEAEAAQAPVADVPTSVVPPAPIDTPQSSSLGTPEAVQPEAGLSPGPAPAGITVTESDDGPPTFDDLLATTLEATGGERIADNPAAPAIARAEAKAAAKKVTA